MTNGFSFTTPANQRTTCLPKADGARRLLVSALLLTTLAAVRAESEVQFNRDIRPILGANCLACHGPDPANRKAGLRLDTKKGMYGQTDKHGAVVTPGKLEESELWRRITTTDEDDHMPPAKSHKTLTAAQKELFREWIVQGGKWQDHWAFIRPARPAVPQSSAFNTGKPGSTIRNPIDAFIAAKLAEKGLTMNHEADRRTLARRLALDLIGLPPTPAQVERFVNDQSPDYYENYVDELMASKQWGEHRARYWLDAARYADTHGLHFDNYREMWPYRDWVIRAFNKNEAFDQFVIEQIAGDLLDHPTEDQLIATGFQRCNATTNEGGTIEAENLAFYANDRVTTTGWVFLGLTTNCSACHDHKFDPFTQKDFYSMAAFYRNTDQGGFDYNWGEGAVYMVAPQGDHDRARWKALPGEIKQAVVVNKLRESYADDAFAKWKAKEENPKQAKKLNKAPLLGDEYLQLALNKAGDGLAPGKVDGKELTLTADAPFAWQDGPLGPAPILTKTNSLNLGDVGAFDQTNVLSFSAWVYLPPDFKGSGSILARMAGPDEHNRGWDFFIDNKRFGIHVIHRWSNSAMKARANDEVLKPGEWQHIVATYDGQARAKGVKLYLNGQEVASGGEADRLEETVKVDLPLRVGRREKDFILDGVAVQDLRVYQRRLDPAEIRALAIAPKVSELLTHPTTNTPPAEIKLADNATDEEKKAAEAAKKKAAEAQKARDFDDQSLKDYFTVTQFAPTRDALEDKLALVAEQETIRAASPVAHIQREKKDSVPTANILMRGQYDHVGDKVEANTPEFLPPMPKGAPRNRLGLAEWLVASDNPLTARVTVNRFWQQIFGTGIVRTVEDFGAVGEPPVNQPLLDWLAVEFEESGWDVKHIFKLMVMSAAYRQEAKVTPDKLEKDPDNRYLSRGPRFRMDAEMLRDYALATSGLLVPKIGGPSVKPYQPPGVWEAVAMPESNTRQYEQDSGAALYRRSMYTFWKRAAPPASMDVLNAPNREICTVRRERTDTPLQALVTMNGPTFVEAARKLAENAFGAAHGSEDGAIDEMAQRVLLRPLTAREHEVVRSTLEKMQTYYEKQPDAAKELLSVGESKPADNIPPTKLAALSMVANQLMNLDEVLNK
ncbi:DUF1553 domain-containing protein [bacterium]|nr:DUF1553 domain-containing protein [bacterium]